MALEVLSSEFRTCPSTLQRLAQLTESQLVPPKVTGRFVLVMWQQTLSLLQ